ncbi:hypothetical protein MASR2M15_17970 [Anaerolineales bacterium]
MNKQIDQNNMNQDDQDNGPETQIMSRPERYLRSTSVPNTDGVFIGDEREIAFVIRGIVERVMVSEKMAIQLGRFEVAKRDCDIDLTPYGAAQRGVSRVHAKIIQKDNRLFLVDLGSTNGTFINRKRIEANDPQPLEKGQEFILGRLPIQIMFK